MKIDKKEAGKRMIDIVLLGTTFERSIIYDLFDFKGSPCRRLDTMLIKKIKRKMLGVTNEQNDFRTVVI